MSMEKITFTSNGKKIVGNLYLPEKASSEKVPGIIVTGTWTSVKEQMANRYAERLSQKGFAALSFDFRNFGESEGEPRDFESPELKIEDHHNAVTFMRSRKEVDPERIGELGICASAGYVLVNTVTDGRVKSLAFVAPWLHNSGIVRALYGNDEGIRQKMDQGRKARVTYEETGEVQYVPALSETDKNAAMPMKLDFYLDPKRGAIPEWPNRFAVMSWLWWLTFDPIRYAKDLHVPIQIVHSEKAATPDAVKSFYENVTAPKDILWTEGEQTDFYDQEPQVMTAIDAVTAHFGKTL